jgi:hypothetical protein
MESRTNGDVTHAAVLLNHPRLHEYRIASHRIAVFIVLMLGVHARALALSTNSPNFC